MKKRALLTPALLLLVILIPLSQSHAATVEVETVHSRETYAPGKDYPIAFRLSIRDPWFLHSNEAGKDEIIPTSLKFQPASGLTIDSIHFPAPGKMKFDYAPDTLDVFSGQVLVSATVRISAGAPSGDQVVRGTLSYQACSPTTCLPPEETPLSIHVPVAPAGSAAGKAIHEEIFNGLAGQTLEIPPRGGTETAFWITLIGLFVGGLALNLTPCIYPLIPITVSYFTGCAGRGTGTVILHASLYMLGLATTNAALGLFAALSGGMLGSALQSPWVLLLVAAVLVALAASFFGLWEIRLPQGLTSFAARDFGGALGSLFMGLTLGIVAAPCIGPFVLGLLTYVGQKGDPFLGFLYFFVLSLGLGLPLAILALFSGAIQKLPLSGDWMLWVRKFMGWVLVAMAAYIAAPLLPASGGRTALMSGVAVAAAIHLALFDRTGRRQRSFLAFKRWTGGALVAFAAYLMFFSGPGRAGIQWMPYQADLLSRAAAEDKPVMVDFYADWCSPCREMDKGVLTEPEIVELSRQYVTLRVDLTTREKGEDELLARYRIRGVPTIIFLDGKGRERQELRIESLAGKGDVLNRMRLGLSSTSGSEHSPR